MKILQIHRLPKATQLQNPHTTCTYVSRFSNSLPNTWITYNHLSPKMLFIDPHAKAFIVSLTSTAARRRRRPVRSFKLSLRPPSLCIIKQQPRNLAILIGLRFMQQYTGQQQQQQQKYYRFRVITCIQHPFVTHTPRMHCYRNIRHTV